jgi:shikimate kinase
VDNLLVRQMGMPIAQIFGKVGEPEFRRMERDAVRAACAAAPVVLVPGGGWAAQAGELDGVRAETCIVYLKCQPSTAAKRAEQGEVRPVLTAEDPVARMRTLLQEREAVLQPRRTLCSDRQQGCGCRGRRSCPTRTAVGWVAVTRWNGEA